MSKKRKLSPEHLAKLQAGRLKAQQAKPALPDMPQGEAPTDVQASNIETMQRQLNELMESNALLKAAVLNQQVQEGRSDSVAIGRGNKVVGEVDKYLIDPSNYPDPTKRLADETRLAPLAFKFNYDLDYTFRVTSYETKTGLNMREPDFLVTLYRIVLDEQGEPKVVIDPKTNKPAIKRYIARRFSFKEDPQAALVIARENSLLVDKSDEKTFLDEMRYLRVRDWLFDYFWPKPATSQNQIQEEVIGNTLVQVSLKSSVEPSAPDFDKIENKITV